MKRNILQIVCSVFLLLNLGLTQIVVDFFHEHSADEREHITLKEGTIVKEAHPICKICKLNLFTELFCVDSYIIEFYSSIAAQNIEFNYDFIITFLSLATGRAPPTLI